MINNHKLVGGLHRVLRRSPVVFAFVCALVLASFSVFSSNKFQGHYGVLRVTGSQGLRQIYEPETFRLSSTKRHPASISELSSEDSVKSLKELVRDAVDRGLVVIVNASDADAAHVLADHSQGARLDISGALDGPTGEILVEVMQELRNMEDMGNEVAELKRKINRYEKEKGNANSKPADHKTSAMALQGEHRFRPSGRALHPLIIFSAFRFALDEFTAVGLAAPSLLPKSFFEVEENSCTWVEWDASSPDLPSPSTTTARVQHGQKRTILIQEGDASPYAVVVIKCRFADPAGSNGYGGHLFINSTSPVQDHVALLTEPPESLDKIQFEGPLQRRFAVCTPPIWRPLPAKILQQWLMYHHHLLGGERIHYFVYTGVPLDDETLLVLQPLLDQQMLTIVDLTSDVTLVGGESRFPSTHLARNDCVHRSRFFADWAILWGFDEFLQMLPPTDLPALVNSNLDAPYLAFGNLRWSSAYCAPEGEKTEEPWATDRMIFRLGLPACHTEKNHSECVGGEGNRRHIVNPRKVYAVHHHFTIDPSWGGADVSTENARVNQWIGNFLSPGEEVCNVVKEHQEAMDPSTAVDGFWYKDVSFAAASRDAHVMRNSSLFNIGDSRKSSAAQNFTVDVR